MFNEDISKIERIRLKLFDLKPKDVLLKVHNFYLEYLKNYFSSGDTHLDENFTHVCCAVCGEGETQYEFELDNIEYHRCVGCGAVYTPKMLKEEILKEMYASGAYQEYFKGLILPKQDLRKNVLEERKCRQVSSFFKGPGKILDIGCGSGSFLDVCRGHGWEVFGVDPSEGAVSTAYENYGIKVIQGYFEDVDFDVGSFDCISIVGIEHLQDPFGSLKRASNFLREDGILFFEVPSADCFLYEYAKRFPLIAPRYFEPGRHYLFFSKETINYIAAQLNLKVEYIESNGLDLETIVLTELDDEISAKILNMQEVLNSMSLSDHYRVYLRK